MEICGWDHGQRTDKGTCALVPPAWDTISELYKQVVKFVSHFPFKKRLVLYFVFRGTSVKVDLGDAKAAGVVCVLGIGVGLGSLLVYKLYYNYIRPIFSRQGSDSNTTTSHNIYQEDDCCFYSGSSDGAANADMGNIESGKVCPPSSLNDSSYGVAFSKNLDKCDITPDYDSVRLRRKGRRQSSLNSDKDSAIGGASELGQSFYSDGGVNRDSFYSTCTAESGFENMPDNFDDASSVGEGYTLSRYPSLSQSLQVNFSPKSLNNKNRQSADVSYGSDEKSGLTIQNGDTLDHSSILLTPPSEDDMSPSNSQLSGDRKNATDNTTGHLHVDRSDKSHSLSGEYDASLEISESLQSYSGGSLGDWSCDEEERDTMSPLPNIQESMSDYQFKQSLLQRLRDWSSFSVDDKSRSPTPERVSVSRTLRRSRSLDRTMSDVCTPDSEIFDNELIDFSVHTTKNLEHIEDELQDIQDEFSMITSQLSDLIHRGDEPQKKPAEHRERSPMARRASEIVHRARTRWERSPSHSYSDSERSSREGSVELAWDLGDIGDDELPRTLRNRRKFRARRQNTLIPEEQSDGSEFSLSSSCDSSPFKIATDTNLGQPQPDLSGVDLEEDSVPGDLSQPSHRSKYKPRGRLKNISVGVSIEDYAGKEWQGNTPKANAIRQAYASIPGQIHCHHLKQIRGDNYCAVRGCLYQILSEGHHVTKSWPGIVDTINKLHQLYQDPKSGLQQWTFASRLPVTDENRLPRMCECMLSLYSTIEDICKLPTYEQRAKYTSDLLNSDPVTDLELMEGVKLLMALNAIELQHASEQGEDVPLFVWLMFARDSCQNVSDFIKNHLNVVGDSAGLEQVEMCLLGHSLGVLIQVARLQNVSQEDFLVKFPDTSPENWPTINLLAEDDRHYNVPIP
ncbi:uncharacterized protein [Haliotis asinina]|uniref:uncharacterized protein isoform X1 n=2 Tax=Haliotis asinina TaxID=109174 RepID=UPI00353198A7